MTVNFVRSGQIVSVSEAEPLPVAARIYTTDVLYLGTITFSGLSYVGLDGSQDPEIPTLTNCDRYVRLLWRFYSNAGGQYRVLGRVTNSNNQPLSSGWEILVAGDIVTGHQSVAIPYGDYGFYDQYRIEIAPNFEQGMTVSSKIVGIR